MPMPDGIVPGQPVFGGKRQRMLLESKVSLITGPLEAQAAPQPGHCKRTRYGAAYTGGRRDTRRRRGGGGIGSGRDHAG